MRNIKPILLPYKHNGSNELDYAIASLEMNLGGDVWVLEDLLSNNPYVDVVLKVKRWLESNSCDGFILTNDDIFIMKPTYLTTNFYRGTLAAHIESRPANDLYKRTLTNTFNYLKQLGIHEPLSYELHVPMLMDKKGFLESAELIQETNPMLIRSLYGNLKHAGGVQMDDVKNVHDFEGKTFLSTSETSFATKPIGQYIRSILDA